MKVLTRGNVQIKSVSGYRSLMKLKEGTVNTTGFVGLSVYVYACTLYVRMYVFPIDTRN